MIMRFWIYVSIFTVLCLPLWVGLVRADTEVAVQGLDAYPALKSYIDKKVIEPFKKDRKKDEKAAKKEKTGSLPPPRLQQKLKSAAQAKGFYDAEVSEAINENEIYTYDVDTGNVYTITNIRFENYEEIPLDLFVGNVLDAERVLKAQRTITNTIAEERCYYNLAVKHTIILDREQQTADIIFKISGNEKAVFGRTLFKGTQTIEQDYLQKLIQYEEGACWQPKLVEETRTALLQTGLIALVDTELPDELPPSKAVPIIFDLKDRAPRKVRLGAGYNTFEGPGVVAEWKHKNIAGDGESVSVKTKIAQRIQSLGVSFLKPFFISKKQSLSADTEFIHQDTDAFDETSFSFGSAINRELSEHWSGSIGGAVELTSLTDKTDNSETTFGLFSFPGSLDFDNRDDQLNPHKGIKFSTYAQPYYDVFGEFDPFFKTRSTATTYFDLSDHSSDPVLALRGSIGNIWGSDTANVPVSKRFYAGGGGSIRGFGFQEASPYEDGNPVGGRSVIEGTAEMRVKFTPSLGGVAFVDAGGAYDDVVPTFDDGLYVGAGVGARYYTSFGPLRFDVAVPVTRKDNTDSAFQVYISIGQAF